MGSRCAKCGHANREGARFCGSCGHELSLQCPACGAELEDSPRFCDACGARLEPTGRTGPESDGARKIVSVLFADLVGSTTWQERLDPESARQVMSRFFEAMRPVIESRGGKIEKFI